ncbi:hypothetical protein QYQ99_23480 [Comamonas testosteroni]|uniref:hypothetical protein n=1 Tax=Comamonas testosteroni TaxID=285 RepID=UPI00265E7369|nr:hypothetical protein [Comamonas testosteroni]WKL15280.1 hypothetical protein QYQ99_23480 [Comamonas testosteroni]
MGLSNADKGKTARLAAITAAPFTKAQGQPVDPIQGAAVGATCIVEAATAILSEPETHHILLRVRMNTVRNIESSASNVNQMLRHGHELTKFSVAPRSPTEGFSMTRRPCTHSKPTRFAGHQPEGVKDMTQQANQQHSPSQQDKQQQQNPGQRQPGQSTSQPGQQQQQTPGQQKNPAQQQHPGQQHKTPQQ